MHKLGFILSLLPALVFAQAANTEVPIEPTAGAGAVVVFGVIVMVGIVAFIVFMSKRSAADAKSGADGK